VVKRGKTKVWSREDTKKLLDSIPRETLAGQRDRALISTMLFSFARISAVLSLKRQDFYYQGPRRWLRFHEKGGKEHEMPAHHEIEETIDVPVQSQYRRQSAAVSKREQGRHRAYGARAESVQCLGSHSQTGAERGLSDAGRVSHLACYGCDGLPGEWRPARACPADGCARESPRTTKLYDRTNDEITIGEVERIQL
jgi:hypothetical protein